MPLKLMYITNEPDIAVIAENAGVNRIFIDMEFIGKDKRQKGLDTVQNHHTIQDIENIKKAVHKAQIVVRVNPIHEGYSGYMNSKEEIDAAIEAGADILMLPYFTMPEEVNKFVEYVDGRAVTLPLLESAKAVECLDEILQVDGIDQIHIGLNDLSLDLGKKFMFEILADGIVDCICNRIKEYEIPFGFGGFGRVGQGILPAEKIIKEHYRLGSQCAILSRSFCNTKLVTDRKEIREIFENGINEIRQYEKTCTDDFEKNHQELVDIVRGIVK